MVFNDQIAGVHGNMAYLANKVDQLSQNKAVSQRSSMLPFVSSTSDIQVADNSHCCFATFEHSSYNEIRATNHIAAREDF